MPPFDPNPAVAQRLLDSIPAAYLVTDHLTFVDVGRRYTEPVLAAYPSKWRLVYTSGDSGSAVYQRVNTTPESGRNQ